MNKNKDYVELKGVVIKCLPGGKFIVKPNEHTIEITCTLSGKLRQNKIHVVEHDVVDIHASIYDLTKGRIVWRY